MKLANYIGVAMFVIPVMTIAASNWVAVPNDMRKAGVAIVGVAVYWAVAIFLVLQ